MKTKGMKPFQSVVIEKKGIWCICQRCLHEWLYQGTKHFTNCPSCHTTVTIKLTITKQENNDETVKEAQI
jgi:hypothetical protein